MCRAQEEKKEDDERVIWENMTPAAWHNSVARKDSIFYETYKLTRSQIENEARAGGHDIIIEVGCGTGDVIGELDIDIPKYGLDINKDFIDFCKRNHDHCEFEIQDAITLTDWWKHFEGKYKKPLVTCVNNTLNIMPEEIRGEVVNQMIQVAGSEGKCLVTYWNGNFFSHAVLNYYKANEDLCGSFEIKHHVDWDRRNLLTPTGYSTEWMLPKEVQKILRSHDVDVETIACDHLIGSDHINTDGLAIFLWFSEDSTSRAKHYYDSDDAQKFYNNIWGEETIHIGRYDLLADDEKTSLSKQEQIMRAQDLHEKCFIDLIKSKCGDEKLRIVDLGCGYGGLLRRLHEAGVIWSAVGCDLSAKMCEQARRLNKESGCDEDIVILEESYLDVSIPSESADLVISMDALLHVGPERQKRAIQEAARILRPGGWMIFSDIMEKNVVDPVEMKPIYDRINLSKLGTVSNYKNAMESAGFTDFNYMGHSSNVSTHYGTIREVLAEKGSSIGISEEYQAKMDSGLKTWRDLAPKNIEWGFSMAKKTKKVDF